MDVTPRGSPGTSPRNSAIDAKKHLLGLKAAESKVNATISGTQTESVGSKAALQLAAVKDIKDVDGMLAVPGTREPSISMDVAVGSFSQGESSLGSLSSNVDGLQDMMVCDSCGFECSGLVCQLCGAPLNLQYGETENVENVAVERPEQKAEPNVEMKDSTHSAQQLITNIGKLPGVYVEVSRIESGL